MRNSVNYATFIDMFLPRVTDGGAHTGDLCIPAGIVPREPPLRCGDAGADGSDGGDLAAQRARRPEK